MSQFVALLRKHLIESKWLLGVTSCAFFAFGLLIVWLAERMERAVAGGDYDLIRDRSRPFRFLGGANMDGSTTALEVAWWNHPLVILTVLSWAVARGSAAVAGEIERGTIDLTLSRPIPRWKFLASHIVFTVLGYVALVSVLIVAMLVGNRVWPTASPPGLTTLLKPGLMVLALGLAVFGYTLPFSAVDVVRWRATMAGAGITLAGLIGMSLAPQFKGQEWIGKLSVFYAYAPVTVALKTDPLAYNATLLLLVFLAGSVLSLFLFARRDLPSNS